MAAVARVTLMSPYCTVGPEVTAPQTRLRRLLRRAVTFHELTALARPPWRTHAPEVGDGVDAGTAEGARGGGALVDVDAAVWPGETRATLTHPPVDAVHTPATVVAGVGSAVVDVVVARGTVPAIRAKTREPVARIDARGAVLARGRVARAPVSCGTREESDMVVVQTLLHIRCIIQ